MGFTTYCNFGLHLNVFTLSISFIRFASYFLLDSLAQLPYGVGISGLRNHECCNACSALNLRAGSFLGRHVPVVVTSLRKWRHGSQSHPNPAQGADVFLWLLGIATATRSFCNRAAPTISGRHLVPLQKYCLAQERFPTRKRR